MTFINYDETRTVQGKKAGAVWGWDAIVSVSESDDDTPTSIGTHIAKVFTSFTEQQKHLFTRKQDYKFAADVTPGKSASVLFYHVHMCVQCEVSVIWLLHLSLHCIHLLALATHMY